MLTIFFKTAWRNIWHRKVFSIINILGLTLGIAVCMLMVAYVDHEWKYDAFHENKDRIYRVVTYVQTPSEDHYFGSAAALGPAMTRAFPQVESMTRISPDHMSVQRPGHEGNQENFLLADSTFFKVFTFPLVKGDRAEALVKPFSIVLSQTAAFKYFGNSDPLGQVLMLDKQYSLTVSAIMRDMPEQSHFRTDMVVSMSTLSKLMPDRDSTSWNSFGTSTYLLLDHHAEAKTLSAQLPAFISKYAGNVMKEAGVKFTLSLEPLGDIYLHSKYGSERSGNATNVYVTSLAALLILLMAIVNFINLATSMAAKRAKETGIRKLVGSSRKSIVVHFLFESLLYSLISFILACGVVTLLMPVMNAIAGQTILRGIFQNLNILLWALGAAVASAILAGLYPALLVSSYKPLTVLNNRWLNLPGQAQWKKGLVVFQFSIAVVLLIATITVAWQVKFMRDQPLGFSKQQMLVMSMPAVPETDKHYAYYKQELSKIPGVISISASSGVPGSQYGNMLIAMENAKGEMQKAGVDIFSIDEAFIRQYNIQILAGRNSSADRFKSDIDNILINEAAMKKFGYRSPAAAIGKRFMDNGKQVIGVVKNFHYRSFREQINPLIMVVNNKFFHYLTINVSTKHLNNTLSGIENRWKELDPAFPFQADFLEDSFNRQFEGEQQFGKLFLYFSALAIFISCLGLYGLTLHTTAQRAREIGIRKVLGASVRTIVALVTRDFLIPVGIGMIIAFPLAGIVMNQWLENFAYRTNLHWWIFFVAGGIALSIALITVALQCVKAAMANPVTTLRSE